MNAVGQVLVEFLLITLVFLVIVVSIAKEIPITFSKASPYLGGKIEKRLETGRGFSVDKRNGGDIWKDPVNKIKGGVKDL